MSGTLTRMRGLRPAWRWIVLAFVAVAIAMLVLLSHGQAEPSVAGGAATAEGDVASYERIVERMRGGEGYYPAAHAVLVADSYGTRSVFNWRTPAWPTILAALPSGGGQVLLGALAALALLLCYRVLHTAGAAVAIVSLASVALSLGGLLVPQSAVFSEVAAGVLILVSIAAYGNAWRWLGFGAALLALFLRELAAPYALICVVLAVRHRRWSEALAWGCGLLAYAVYYLWHWSMVLGQLGPMDRAYDQGWLQFGGLDFVLATLGFNGLWSLGPNWPAAVLLPLGLFGLWAWPNARAFATVLLYVVAFTVVGKPFNGYWGAIYTPVLMLGLGWVWPAVADALRVSVPRPRPREG